MLAMYRVTQICPTCRGQRRIPIADVGINQDCPDCVAPDGDTGPERMAEFVERGIALPPAGCPGVTQTPALAFDRSGRAIGPAYDLESFTATATVGAGQGAKLLLAPDFTNWFLVVVIRMDVVHAADPLRRGRLLIQKITVSDQPVHGSLYWPAGYSTRWSAPGAPEGGFIVSQPNLPWNCYVDCKNEGEHDLALAVEVFGYSLVQLPIGARPGRLWNETVGGDVRDW